MIIAHYDINDLPHKEVVLPWQAKGLQYTATGYGRKIPTRHMVKLPGSDKWLRVYCCIFSNAGTCYVPDAKGNWTTIDGSPR
jgi:hypothetical protein